jgi:hypothetical protein
MPTRRVNNKVIKRPNHIPRAPCFNFEWKLNSRLWVFIIFLDPFKHLHKQVRLRRDLEDNIKRDLKEIGWENVDWIQLAPDAIHWRPLLITNEIMCSIRDRKFLEQLRKCQFLKKRSVTSNKLQTFVWPQWEKSWMLNQGNSSDIRNLYLAEKRLYFYHYFKMPCLLYELMA